MKLTKKQIAEVNYLKTWSKCNVSDEEVYDFITITTKGVGNGGKFSNNQLVVAQQRLGVTLALWKKDLTNGLLSIDELLEEASCEYEKDLIMAVRNSINRNYRVKNIENGTVLSFTNFPDVMKTFANT